MHSLLRIHRVINFAIVTHLETDFIPQFHSEPKPTFAGGFLADCLAAAPLPLFVGDFGGGGALALEAAAAFDGDLGGGLHVNTQFSNYI